MSVAKAEAAQAAAAPRVHGPPRLAVRRNVLACSASRTQLSAHADHRSRHPAGTESFSVAFNKVRRLSADGTAPADALLDRIRLTVFTDAVDVRVEAVVQAPGRINPTGDEARGHR